MNYKNIIILADNDRIIIRNKEDHFKLMNAESETEYNELFNNLEEKVINFSDNSDMLSELFEYLDLEIKVI